MNKHERHLAGCKAAARRAKKCGFTEKFEDLPLETKKAFISPDKIQIKRSSTKKNPVKKRFKLDNNQPKKYYGHFSGRPQTHLSKNHLKERADERDNYCRDCNCIPCSCQQETY